MINSGGDPYAVPFRSAAEYGSRVSFASEFWFLAFAIATAASVRTLALVEVLFAQGVTRFIFKQPTSKRELAGIVLVVGGVALLVWAY